MLSRQRNLSQAAARSGRRRESADPVLFVRDAARLGALAHPIRVQILEALREPGSAATVARAIGQPRQKVNYHLKELEEARMVTLVGERRTGNFVESLYQAVARTFLVSPEVAWADGRRSETLADQHSLGTLVLLGERLQRDAAVLLDRAAYDGTEIASASVVAEARFEDEAAREEFLSEYLHAISNLLERYGSKSGEPYRVLLAAYPETEGGQE